MCLLRYVAAGFDQWALVSPDLEEKNNWAHNNLCGVPRKAKEVKWCVQISSCRNCSCLAGPSLGKTGSSVCALVTYPITPLNDFHLSPSHPHILGLITTYQAWPQTPALPLCLTRTHPYFCYTKEASQVWQCCPRLTTFPSLLSHLIASTKGNFTLLSFTPLKLCALQGDHWDLNKSQTW